MKNEWQPGTVDPNVASNPDWVKVYTVAIPNLPLVPNKEVKKFLKWISGLKGFVGLRPEYPHGTLLFFQTENDAKGARNLIKDYKGYQGTVGDNICECYIPKQYAKEAHDDD